MSQTNLSVGDYSVSRRAVPVLAWTLQCVETEKLLSSLIFKEGAVSLSENPTSQKVKLPKIIGYLHIVTTVFEREVR